jgi:hypothetical protein
LKNLTEAGLDHGGGIGNWQGDFLGKACKGVRDTFPLGGPDVRAIASIRIKGGSNIPAIDPMGGSGLAMGWLFVDDNMDTGGAMGVQLKS